MYRAQSREDRFNKLSLLGLLMRVCRQVPSLVQQQQEEQCFLEQGIEQVDWNIHTLIARPVAYYGMDDSGQMEIQITKHTNLVKIFRVLVKFITT